MNEVARIDENRGMQTAASVKAHVQLVQEVMRGVMKPGTHYGQIPGTQKPTLYKAGSEVLLSTFRIAVDPQVEDLSTSDEIRYRVKAVGVHQTSGIVVGTGIGECSSNEEKYRWRKAVCDEEFDATPEDRRRVVYKRGKGGSAYTISQVRTEPADVANTVLKMAKKRAQIDLCLTATAASDIFDQDLEDLPEGLRQEVQERSGPAEPQPKSAGGGGGKTITDGQRKIITSRLDSAGVGAEEFCEAFGIDSVPKLPAEKINDALAWIDNARE